MLDFLGFHRHKVDPWVASLSMPDRASPARAAGRYAQPGSSGFFDIERAIRRENIRYLLAKLATNGGVVLGYHGTTTPRAERIMQVGPQNHMNQEGHAAFSVWDETVPGEAIRFAERRSREAGLGDGGRILLVETRNPIPDTGHGRLEWFADAAATRVLGVYAPQELAHLLGQSAIVPLQRLAG